MHAAVKIIWGSLVVAMLFAGFLSGQILPDQGGPVYFADENLKFVVEEQLGLPDPNQADLLTLESLDAYCWGITDLTGLEHATGLKNLVLESNLISDLKPLLCLTELEYLNLLDNPLSCDTIDNDIPVILAGNRPELELHYDGVCDDCDNPVVINFADVRLKDAIESELGVINPTSCDMLRLESLHAGSMGITDLSGLEYATGLRSLGVSGNLISDLKPLLGLTELESLYLQDNPLSCETIDYDIPVIKAGNRPELELYFDEVCVGCDNTVAVNFVDARLKAEVESELGIIDPTSCDMRRLERLEVHATGITDLMGLEHATRLRELTVYENQITDVSALSGLQFLILLDLNHNLITDISPLKELARLRFLYLGDNKIAELPDMSGLKSLNELDLNGNNIKDISCISALIGLESLDLWGNEISDISVLRGLENLMGLELSNNNITDISPLSGLVNLRYFSASNNYVSDVSSLTGMSKLNYIYLKYNPLSCATVVNDIPVIKNNNPSCNFSYDANCISDPGLVVHFSDIRLRAAVRNKLGVNFPVRADVAGLTSFNAGQAKISSLTGLEYATGLQDLRLPHNQIKDLTPLSNLNNLRYLDLHDNSVSYLNPLQELSKLQYLNLSDNQIRFVWPLSYLHRLQVLDLEWNRLWCESIEIDMPVIENNNPGLTIRYDEECIELVDMSYLIRLAQYWLTEDCYSMPGCIKADYYVDGRIDMLDFSQMTMNWNGWGIDYGFEKVNFADDIVKLAVENELGIADPTTLDMRHIRELIMFDGSVSNLTGLEYAVNLETLILPTGQVSDLSPLSELHKLHYLRLCYNQITDLGPLTSLTNIYYLELDHNPLSCETLENDMPVIEANNPYCNISFSEGCQ